jgi:hypothetical protein
LTSLVYLLFNTHCSLHFPTANLKKKPRPGPETWVLRGAARPASEVYDFDVRYVDPHVKAMEDANEKARRSVNVLVVCRGRFALEEEDLELGLEGSTQQQTNKPPSSSSFKPPQPQCRQYLSLLTQLGALHLTRKNYSTARTHFLSAIELEGTHHPYSITNARMQLMNMYLSTNRPSSARKLWMMLDSDGSAWVRYSAALIEYVSWNLLKEEGSTAESAEVLLTKAIRGNVYVAYLLGWKDMFQKTMEYIEELVEMGDGGLSGSILEGVEYYGCGLVDANEDDGEMEKGMGMWLGTEGSLEWVRSVILRVLNEANSDGSEDEDRLTKADLLSWETQLAKEEEVFEKERGEKEQSRNDDYNDDREEGSNDDEEEPDLLMYAGMFRTAMDWLTDAGEFLKAPSYEYLIEEDDADMVEQLPEKVEEFACTGSDDDSESDDAAKEDADGSDDGSKSSIDSS